MLKRVIIFVRSCEIVTVYVFPPVTYVIMSTVGLIKNLHIEIKYKMYVYGISTMAQEVRDFSGVVYPEGFMLYAYHFILLNECTFVWNLFLKRFRREIMKWRMREKCRL